MITQLNNRVTELQATNEQQQAVNEELQRRIALQEMELAWYKEQMQLAKQRQFGHSSESSAEQLALFHFNEAEQTADPQAEEAVMEPTASSAKKRCKKQIGKREKFWEKLPVEVIVHALPEEEQVCPACGDSLHEMSEEVRYELKVIPPQFIAVKHVRKVYACRRCQKEGENTPVITAAAPKPPIEKSIASPSALAYILEQKYVNGMPLYRIWQYLQRLEIDISRQNLANWVIQASDLWLKPLYDELHRQLLQRSVAHSDETPIQVLREKGRAATTKSSMWLYASGACDKEAIVLYDYRTTKAAKCPKAFLQGFVGYLHVDGAPAYEAAGLVATILVCCWSHARRGFIDTLKAAPKGVSTWGTHAARGLEFCDMLFELEDEYAKAKLTFEERHQERQIYSVAVLDAFYDWLKKERPKVTPKSLLGKAMDYCLHQWPKLRNFLFDGRLEISNNRAERCIKPFVIGRKNWLFSVSPQGAEASAVAYSIMETAKANGLKPFEYLTWLFECLPNMRLTEENLQSVLPWSSSIPDECKMASEDAS